MLEATGFKTRCIENIGATGINIKGAVQADKQWICGRQAFLVLMRSGPVGACGQFDEIIAGRVDLVFCGKSLCLDFVAIAGRGTTICKIVVVHEIAHIKAVPFGGREGCLHKPRLNFTVAVGDSIAVAVLVIIGVTIDEAAKQPAKFAKADCPGRARQEAIAIGAVAEPFLHGEILIFLQERQGIDGLKGHHAANGAGAIEKFLVSRRLMYWQVYLHKTVLCAEKMMVNIIKRAKAIKAESPSATLNIFLSDDYKQHGIEKFLTEFCDLDDYDFLNAIKQWGNHYFRIAQSHSSCF